MCNDDKEQTFYFEGGLASFVRHMKGPNTPCRAAQTADLHFENQQRHRCGRRAAVTTTVSANPFSVRLTASTR